MRRIAVVSDMHVGSRFAIAPAHWCYEDGSWFHASPLQGALEYFWQDFWKKAGDVDTVILLGDLCDGNNRKEYGRCLTTPELEVQVAQAVSLLEPHCKNRKVYGVGGSGYHQSLEMSLDKAVVEHVGGKFLGVIETLQIETHTVNVAHSIGSAAIYRASMMDRECLFLDVAYARNKLPRLDVVLRGHLHWYGELRDAGKHCMVAPGWKCWFPFKGRADNFGRMQPDIGACVIELSNNGRKRCVIDPFLYDLPTRDQMILEA